MHLISEINPINLIKHLWAYRELITQFTEREIEGRYRGSFLGVIWSIIYPLFNLLIYTFIFGIVFQARWPQSKTDSLGEFALVIFCGYSAFSLFSESVSRAPSIITSVPNYVKKVVFPLEILPISIMGAAIFHLLVSLGILLIIELAFGFIPSWTVFLLPIVILPAIMFSMGLMWFLASLGVFVRDVNQAIGLVVQALVFLTPLFYALESVPEPFRTIIQFNPMTGVVENTRRILLWGYLPDWFSILIWIPVSLVFMMLGYNWFARTKKAFSDVI